MQNDTAQKTFRRLVAAEGYLELGLPHYALEELDAIQDAGPLAPPMHYMRGEALRAQQRYEDAIQPLQRAAQLIPAPHNKQAWLALSDCLRHRGQETLAEVVESLANTPPQTRPVLNINITIQKQSHAVNEDDLGDETDLLN